MFTDRRFEKSRYFFPLVLIAAWTAFGLFFGTQNYIRDVYGGKPASFPGHVIAWLVCGYSWGILTTPILRFARRFSLERLGWSWFFLVHIPASVVFSALALGVYVLLFKFLLGGNGKPLGAFYAAVFVNEFQSEILIYLLIVSVATVYRRAFPSEPAVELNAPQEIVPGQWAEEAPVTGNGHLKRLSIKDNGRISLVDVDIIDWIESYGNYLKIHTAETRHLHRETMANIERKLDPQTFIRVRRSAIVRLDQIQELRPIAPGEYEILLKNGIRLSSTRHYKKNIETLVKP